MDYSSYLSGTPLFPIRLLLFIAFGFFAILSLVYTFLRRKQGKTTLVNKLKLLLKTTFTLGVLTGIFASYYLLPPPAVTKVNTSKERIEVTFNRPVSRRMLEKKIVPEVPGVWVFGKGLYGAHFVKSVTFYPDNPLSLDTQYKLTFSSIVNTLRSSSPYTYEFTFKTEESPLVSLAGEDSKMLTAHFYPADGERSVNIDSKVRVVFESVIDKKKIEEEFSILPGVGGKIDWDGNSLIFIPASSLAYNTKYTISVLNFSASFTTSANSFKLDAPAFLQMHALSCEVATLRMALAYRGISVTEEDLLSQVGYDPTPHNGNVWGNPYQAFVGNVDGRQMVTGYGVYWGPIARVARNYRSAQEFEGWSISKLTNEIKKGNPVIIWVYSKSGVPTHWYTPSGEKIYAVSGEHTVLVVGYVGTEDNPSQLIINDSLIGQVYWSRAIFDKKWDTFNRSGVVVY